MIPGLDGFGSIGTLFAKRVRDHWEFDCLETYIVQPTRAYVQRCLESDEVKSHIARVKTLGAWSVYMITGLAVARGGGKNLASTESARGAVAGVGV